jgi:hypothetical protein
VTHTHQISLRVGLALLSLVYLACGTEPDSKSATPQVDSGPAEEECVPRDLAPGMPSTANAYAELCSRLLGQMPTADCGEGVRIPITVDGVEVFETPSDNICDNFGFKGTCDVGSTLRRQEGVALDGSPRPEVVWVTFCRAVSKEYVANGLGSVQMIGHDMQTGATCFFESPDALGIGVQAEWAGMNADGILDGQLPSPGDPDFNRAFVTPPSPCSQCHHNDPFIHNPWIDGARLPEDPAQSVLPEIASSDSPYWVVGGPYWDLRTPHIEGNSCVECHRMGMGSVEAFELAGAIDIEAIMPPYDPGSATKDFDALRACWEHGPSSSPQCEWVDPPGTYCDD